jgi:quercetin dioxygenase-like cupin family protein
MSGNFVRIAGGMPVAGAVAELSAHPNLWGQQTARLGAGSPHRASTDIWLRYRDVDAYVAEHGTEMSRFCDEHESVWLPPSRLLPACVGIAKRIAGERPLGGVLLTKLPPGRRIERHTDSGWHAEAHDKLYVAIQVAPGMKFCWDDGAISATDGDVYWFRNDVPHWVENPTDTDRISMIVCVRKDR